MICFACKTTEMSAYNPLPMAEGYIEDVILNTLIEIDHEIISTVILLLLILEGILSVKSKVLVNRLPMKNCG